MSLKTFSKGMYCTFVESLNYRECSEINRESSSSQSLKPHKIFVAKEYTNRHSPSSPAPGDISTNAMFCHRKSWECDRMLQVVTSVVLCLPFRIPQGTGNYKTKSSLNEFSTARDTTV